MAEFQGVFVPMVTPFTDDDQLDLDALAQHIDALIAGGVQGLVPAGSTGEALSLRPDEYRTLVAETIRHVAHRVPVIPGCSANSTRDVIANCLAAEELGADGLMTVHPFYALPSERELFNHYRRVGEQIHRPLMIYNNPFTTGVDASPELLGELSRVPHIEYVKESSGDATRVLRIARASEGRLKVFSGTDNLALEHFVSGATGWVAGAANVMPEACVSLYRQAVVERRFDAALDLYRRMHPYLTMVETGSQFVRLNKAAVNLMGRHAGAPRSPLAAADEQEIARVRVALQAVLGDDLGVTRAKEVVPATA